MQQYKDSYYSIEETSENKSNRKEKHVYIGKRQLCISAGKLTVTQIVFIHLLLDKDAFLLTCNFGLAWDLFGKKRLFGSHPI
jgi:hypothetical protein